MTANNIDMKVFSELQANAGADFVTELVETFLEEVPLMIDAMRAALATGDANQFRRTAHSLKTNGLTFGAMAMSAQARELELTGLEQLGAGTTAAIDRLQESCAQAAADLRELCHE
jgi:HPt (histidine-containing phosphotransfer) domain-containing protein